MTVPPTPGTGIEPLWLRDLTTFRVGGPAADWVIAESTPELVGAVQEADHTGRQVFIVAGGSNMLVADDPIVDRLVLVRSTGVATVRDGSIARVTAAAGENWDEFVSYCVTAGFAGIEALAGIPGLVGSTPIQNVGAYGQSVNQTIESVGVLDRMTGELTNLSAAECQFAYRDSVFKRSPQRYVVLDVTFALRVGAQGSADYAQLADSIGIDIGESAPIEIIREHVLELRRSKGMVLDEADHDTWSAGSFFTNPIVAQGIVPDGAPAWPMPGTGDQVKTSAAWLIEHAGMKKGFGLPGPASLSTKHTLALTNRGAATAADVCALARTVRDGVHAAFGITLVPEINVIGCTI